MAASSSPSNMTDACAGGTGACDGASGPHAAPDRGASPESVGSCLRGTRTESVHFSIAALETETASGPMLRACVTSSSVKRAASSTSPESLGEVTDGASRTTPTSRNETPSHAALALKYEHALAAMLRDRESGRLSACALAGGCASASMRMKRIEFIESTARSRAYGLCCVGPSGCADAPRADHGVFGACESAVGTCGSSPEGMRRISENLPEMPPEKPWNGRGVPLPTKPSRNAARA